MSWANETEADAYLLNKFGADDWAALSSTIKNQLLSTSNSWLDNDPAYSFPDTASEGMKNAEIELAWYLYNNQSASKRIDLQNAGVESFKIGQFEETYKSGSQYDQESTSTIYPLIVKNMIKAYKIANVFIGRKQREID